MAAVKPAAKAAVAARVPSRFPPSRVGRSQSPAVSWAGDDDGDQVNATTTPSPSPFAPSPSRGLEQRPQASAWGNNADNAEEGGGGGGGGVTAASPLIPPPVCVSAWGDDSDDIGVVDASPFPAPTTSGLDVSSCPSRHSRPFRMATAAAVPPPRLSVPSPTTSWGNGGESDVSGSRPLLSRPFPVGTAVAAAAPAATSPLPDNNNAPPLYCPAGQVTSGGGDHGGVIAPLSGPFSHQESGPDQRLLSWADEDEESGGSFGGGGGSGGGGGNTRNTIATGSENNLRGQENLGRSSMSPAWRPTTPGAEAGSFAFDFAGRVPPQRRETLASTYPVRRPCTPSTTVPSPWPNSPQGSLARETATPGGERGFPSDLDSSISPTHGGGAWGGRRFTYTYSAGLSPRLGPFHAPGSSPSSSSPPLRPFNHGSPWHPRQDRDDGNDGNGSDNKNENDNDNDNGPQRLTPLPATSGGGGGWLQGAKRLFRRQRDSSVDGVAGDVKEDGGPKRKRSNKQGNSKGSSGKKRDDGDGEGSGVRAWTFWDNFRNAPGLIARLCVCVLAVCALWATSLSVAGEQKNVLLIVNSVMR